MKGFMNPFGATTLIAVASRLPQPPSMGFSRYFPVIKLPGDNFTWEYALGSAGMSPVVAPGSPAPIIGKDGSASGSASVAYWKEKMFLDETTANNTRRIGTLEYETAQRQIAEMITKLMWRSKRRQEWFAARALLDSKLVYTMENGHTVSVDFGRPVNNRKVLAGNYRWGQSAAQPLKDILDLKEYMADMHGVRITILKMNSKTLRLLADDPSLIELFKKSGYGDGGFLANPERELGKVLDITFELNDDFYDVPAEVTGVAGTAITVDNARDFSVGGKLFAELVDKEFREEFRTIVSISGNVVTVDSAFTTLRPGKDRVTMRKKYLLDGEVCALPSSFDGNSIGNYYLAPFGLPTPRYGMYVDSDMVWDPDGLYMRVQNKGLPVVRSPQAVFTLVVN